MCTGGIHGEEQGVHEELKHLLLPGPFGAGVPTQATQQLGACCKAGHVVGTTGQEPDIKESGIPSDSEAAGINVIHYQFFLYLWFLR